MTFDQASDVLLYDPDLLKIEEAIVMLCMLFDEDYEVTPGKIKWLFQNKTKN